jgi:hypothetical protein
MFAPIFILHKYVHTDAWGAGNCLAGLQYAHVNKRIFKRRNNDIL